MSKAGKIAIVVRDSRTRDSVERLFDPATHRVICPGQCIAGHRFSAVLVTSAAYERMMEPRGVAERDKIRRWWLESVESRLTVDGKVVYI